MRFLVLFVGVAIAAQGACAEKASVTRWRCGYQAEPAPAMACTLVRAATPGSAAPDTPREAEALPSIVRRIRADPEWFADQVVIVPLHAPPIDMRQAERLARAVMCGPRAACEVLFAAPGPP